MELGQGVRCALALLTRARSLSHCRGPTPRTMVRQGCPISPKLVITMDGVNSATPAAARPAAAAASAAAKSSSAGRDMVAAAAAAGAGRLRPRAAWAGRE